jgi:uncharacterized repeat protein (TIGR03803 family)
MKHEVAATSFALCTDNGDYRASPILGKVYRILPDPAAAKDDPTISGMTADGGPVLYSFTGGFDGGYPQAGVIRDRPATSMALFFTAENAAGYQGLGVVFKLDTAGRETVLYTFTGAGGWVPYAGVIDDFGPQSLWHDRPGRHGEPGRGVPTHAAVTPQ